MMCRFDSPHLINMMTRGVNLLGDEGDHDLVLDPVVCEGVQPPHAVRLRLGRDVDVLQHQLATWRTNDNYSSKCRRTVSLQSDFLFKIWPRRSAAFARSHVSQINATPGNVQEKRRDGTGGLAIKIRILSLS
jgi:hypothetical protein